MKRRSRLELDQVREEFEAWRTTRIGKGRIPELLWTKALSLLDSYPISVVSRELRLDYQQLRQRHRSADLKEQEYKNRSEAFLSLSGDELTGMNLLHKRSPTLGHLTPAGPDCRIVLERADGSRLSLNFPLDWSRIESLCWGFLRS